MAGDFEGNPFADPEGINPFADPAVTNVTKPASSDLEEYNPFAEEGKQKKKESDAPRLPPPPTKAEVKAKDKQKKDQKRDKKKDKPATQWPPANDSSPAVLQPDQDSPPAYSAGASAFKDPRDDEMRKREEEIARREAELKERERNVERLGPAERKNNFPPFPAFCPSPLKPCFYINIRVEVPPPEQWKMYSLLGLVIYTWVLLVINVLVAIVGAATIGESHRSDALTTMGVSILYLVLFLPGTFFCWFLPVYYAYRQDSSLAFMWFFFVMLFQILSYALNGIGVPRLGACGFFNGVVFFDQTSGDAQATGAMFMIMGFLWFFGIPVAVILLFLVHRYYRSSGASINKATQEAMSGAAGNKYVRGAVKSGVSAGVKASME